MEKSGTTHHLRRSGSGGYGTVPPCSLTAVSGPDRGFSEGTIRVLPIVVLHVG